MELISLKRERLHILLQACLVLDKKLKKSVKRINDVLFSYSETFLSNPYFISPNGAEEF